MNTTVSRKQQFVELLRHLLELRTNEGNPLINRELFFLEIFEDIEGRYGRSNRPYAAEELIKFAYEGDGALAGNDLDLVFNAVELRYRKMVCGVGRLEWLCGPPGPQWLLKSWPVYFTDHETGKRYVFK